MSGLEAGGVAALPWPLAGADDFSVADFGARQTLHEWLRSDVVQSLVVSVPPEPSWARYGLTARRLASLCREAKLHGKPFVLVHLAEGSFWDAPEVRRLLRMRGVTSQVTDACMWGAATRALLRICGWKVDVGALQRRCDGTTRRSLCSHTGRAHLRVQGRAPAHWLWATLPEVVTRLLALKIGRALGDVRVMELADAFQFFVRRGQ